MVGDYSAKVYSYPRGINHASYEEKNRVLSLDSNGVTIIRTETQTVHLMPQRIPDITKFFMNIDKKLNIYARYSAGGLIPTTEYQGKGKLDNDTLYIDFFRKDIFDFNRQKIGSTLYDVPFQLKFSVEKDKSRKSLDFKYYPERQKLNIKDSLWSVHYLFEM
jgi:hypothetical protein